MQVFTLTALACLVACAAAAPLLHTAPEEFKFGSFPRSTTAWHELEAKGYGFDDYKAEFGKTYAPEEEADRRAVFEANLKQIIAHNKDTSSTWRAGVNHLTDKSDAELKKMMGYKRMDKRSLDNVDFSTRKTDVRDLPKSVDWRLKGAVTPVKDQGQCGSCWTFATAETVESHYFVKTKQLVELSEQQVASCTPNPKHCGGTGGCEGGTAEVGFEGIITAGGLASEWTYPYVSHNGTDYQCAAASKGAPVAKLASYVKLPENEYEPLMEAVANKGPIAISVAAMPWKDYEGGIFDGCTSDSPDIDHAVQLVGYGTENGVDYWIVRNSWTATWGEGGYIRLKRQGAKAECAIDKTPSHGSGCQGGPSEVKVCGTCGILYDTAYPVIA